VVSNISDRDLDDADRILIAKDYLRCDRTRTGRVRTGTVEPTDKALRWRSRARERDEPPGGTGA
jgi:hypothetical protein